MNILQKLHSAGEYGDPEIVVRNSNLRYWKIIKSHPKLNELEESIGLLSPQDRWFLLRSTPFRVCIDRFISDIYTGKSVNREENIKKIIRSVKLLNLNAKKDYQTRWTSAGFDISHSLSHPFPLLTNAWIGYQKSSEEFWNESLELAHIFCTEILSPGAETCELRPLSPEFCELLETAIEGISNISEFAVRDVIMNVSHIALMDYSRWKTMSDNEPREIGHSLSRHLVPSTIFLSIIPFQSLPELIEAIYHESLHRKLGNILLSKKILKDSYDARKGPFFICPWNKDRSWNTNAWAFDRTLDAYHVYLHLAAFYQHVCLFSKNEFITMKWANHRKSVALDRCKFLGEWLKKVANSVIEKDGEELLSFLFQAESLLQE